MNKSQLVEYFGRTDFHPKHRLGQNFLTDPNLARKLVDYAGLAKSDTVVEVGPGMGMITREILSRGVSLIAIERDHSLLEYLEATLVHEFPDQMKLVKGDAVDLPLGGSTSAADCHVIANPPFSITGPWLAGILDIGFPHRFSLLLQKEAVERITAKAGNKHFGTLAIRLDAAYDCVQTHPVPPQCFYPAPKIDSMIVVFKRREDPYRFYPASLKLIQTLFTQRRKQVGGRLKKLLPEDQVVRVDSVLSANDLSLQSRPEQISTSTWIELDSIFQDSLSL